MSACRCCEQPLSHLETNEGGCTLCAAGTGQDTEHDLWETEHCLGRICGHAVVAGQRQLKTTTQTLAINGSDLRLAATRDTHKRKGERNGT